MKVILLTNMPAYQQLELGKAFAMQLGEQNFRLATFGSLSAERKEMGWIEDLKASYLLRFDQSDKERRETLDWIRDADVVIHGRFPIRYVRHRIKQGRLTYAYQERVWKKRRTILRLLSRLPFLWKNYFSVNRPNYHLLAAGRYAASDLAALGQFKNRMWKFGYFVAPARGLITKPATSSLQLVWCGRLMPLKRPQRAIELLKILTDQQIDAQLTMIGHGEMAASLQEQADQLELTKRIRFVGWQPVAQVNKVMANAHIMLMSSDHREGWGVVINEAINNACFPMVCAEVGSAQWLIRDADADTGIVYADEQFAEHALLLAQRWLESPEAVLKAAQEGSQYLHAHWSTTAAADRLIRHAQVMLQQDALSAKAQAEKLFEFGPCSSA